MVSNQGDLEVLQKELGPDYQTNTEGYEKMQNIWASPVREYARHACGTCGKEHFLDTACD